MTEQQLDPKYHVFVEVIGGLSIGRGAVVEETEVGTVFEFECIQISVGERYLLLNLGDSGLHLNHDNIRSWREYRIEDNDD